MVETTTFRLLSGRHPGDRLIRLLDEDATFDSIVNVAEQDTGAYSLTDNLGYGYFFARLLPEGSSLTVHAVDESLRGVPEVPVAIGRAHTRWHGMPRAPRSIEQGLVERSNCRNVWFHSYGLGPQDNTATWSFGPHAGQATRNRLDEAFTFTDVDSSAEVWEDLLRELIGWEETGTDDHSHEQLAAMLRTSFEVDPVEDGMQHPAEQIIAEALRSADDQPVLEWLKAFSTDAAQPSFAASILRCLARENVGPVSWRVELVRDGLATDSVEIRDAAVQAAETWGDPDLLEALGSHSEKEPWLRQYISDVIDDLAR